MKLSLVSLAGILTCSVMACGGSSSSTNDTTTTPSGGDDASTTPATGDDAGNGSTASDSGQPSTNDATSPVDANLPNDPIDGPPARQQCTPNFASGLSYAHGRLDGYVVTVLSPGQGKQCNGDSSHIHLQIKMNGGIYDVAMNTDTNMLQKDVALPDGAWTEGWHSSDNLDYPSNLGIHSTEFTQATDVATVEAALANANHVSIFGMGYSDSTGAHDIHRKGSGEDGALFIDPLGATPHAFFFCFSTDNF